MKVRHTTYPHLPRAWRDAVALELRLRGADGRQTGDALAVAETHCADSGEEVSAAFGSPQDYAAGVVLPTETADRAMALIRGSLPTIPGVAGLLVGIAAADAWVRGGSTSISWGLLASALVIVAAALALVWRGDLFLRHAWVGGLAMTASLAAVVALSVGITAEVVALPVVAAGWIAGLLLAVGVVWSLVDDAAADPILDPLQGDLEPRTTRLLTALQPWFFVAGTLVGVLLILVIGD